MSSLHNTDDQPVKIDRGQMILRGQFISNNLTINFNLPANNYLPKQDEEGIPCQGRLPIKGESGEHKSSNSQPYKNIGRT